MSDDWLKRLIPEHPLWFVWAGGSLLTMWAFFWWSLGMFPSDAFGSGFARAEQSKLNTQMLLETRLMSTRQKQCLADNGEVKLFWASELIRLKNLYREELGVEYHEPPCSSIIVATASADD